MTTEDVVLGHGADRLSARCTIPAASRALVVALHGGGMRAGYFDAPACSRLSFADRAVRNDVAVLAVDRPGYGASTAGLDIADQATALWEALDAFHRTTTPDLPVVLLGHSFGSEVAIAMAGDPRGSAGRHLVGISLSGIGAEMSPRGAAESDRLRTGEGRRGDVVTMFWGEPELYPPDTLDPATRPVAEVSGADEAESARWEDMAAELAARVTVPVQVAYGDREPWWPAGRAGLERFAALFVAAPWTDLLEQRVAAHNISLGFSALPYHLKVLGFVEDCLLPPVPVREAGMTETNPAASTLPWPPAAHFGWQTVVGPHQPDAAAMIDDRGFFGLVPEGTFLYGNLRAEDGTMWEVTRRIPTLDTARGLSRLVLQSTLNDEGVLHIDQAATRGSGTSKGGTKTLTDDGVAVWASADDGSVSPWRVTMTADTCSWREEGLFEITGELLPPGLQWYVAGPDKGTFYLSQLFEVRGTVGDTPVRGMIGLDRDYMPEGGMLYVEKDIVVGEALHNTWYTWATRYTDGTFDAGHFMLGNDRGGFALITNERQEVVATTEIDGEIFPGSDRNFPEGISLEIQGEKWEFLPDPRGIMPDWLDPRTKLPTPQNEGRWRRVGDTREPEVWFAWGEIAPGHGTTPRQRWRS